MIDPELAKIAKTLQEMPFPTRFAVEVCADCNIECIMCHHPKMRRPKGTMPLELWKKCADEIAIVSPHTQCWFSFCGEPFLEPDLLLRMVAYGKKVGLHSVNLNTNGLLVTPELAKPIMDSGADLIVFGIDGFSREIYEKIRAKGNRDELYVNVEHFLKERQKRKSGPGVEIQFIEMDENEHEREKFIAYWLKRGASLKVRNKLSWGGMFETPLDIPKEERIPCPWAMTMMHVFWDGRVPRCPGDIEGEESVGNAWHESLVVLWQQHLAPYRKKQLEHRFDELPERCKNCKDWMTGAATKIHPPSPVLDTRKK